MYSGGGGITLLSPFSLGIIPFINSSILIDLLTALFPSLEKLQQEEGELGRKKLNFYKKIVTLLFAIGQSILLISYLKPYFYDTSFFSYLITNAAYIYVEPAQEGAKEEAVRRRKFQTGSSMFVLSVFFVIFMILRYSLFFSNNSVNKFKSLSDHIELPKLIKLPFTSFFK
jgi:hypothetical protein